MNSFSSCLSEKFCIPPAILNDILMGRWVFPFRTLKISCHYYLTAKVCAEKSADHLMGIPLYKTVLFLLPLEFSNISFFNYMSWYGSVWVHLVWEPVCFLYLDNCFLLQVWNFLAMIPSNAFFITFFNLTLFVHWFMAPLGLHCCLGFALVVVSVCYSLVVVCRLLIAEASLLARHGH